MKCLTAHAEKLKAWKAKTRPHNSRREAGCPTKEKPCLLHLSAYMIEILYITHVLYSSNQDMDESCGILHKEVVEKCG